MTPIVANLEDISGEEVVDWDAVARSLDSATFGKDLKARDALFEFKERLIERGIVVNEEWRVGSLSTDTNYFLSGMVLADRKQAEAFRDALLGLADGTYYCVERVGQSKDVYQ